MSRIARLSLGRSSAIALAAFVAGAGDAASQQRRPALEQVRVPHSYYWREMFVPQPTSGASAVTWSPDGRELIYSTPTGPPMAAAASTHIGWNTEAEKAQVLDQLARAQAEYGRRH